MGRGNGRIHDLAAAAADGDNVLSAGIHLASLEIHG
jgi:hypothetical protein